MKPKRVLILGAAGRDFHNFNMVFRNNPHYKVVGFTATQIEGLQKRLYPHSLAGKLYPKGIQIYPETKIKRLIKDLQVELVVFSYSDISHTHVMHMASIALSEGADFMLLGPDSTQLKSKKSVISVCAVRTGSGKGTVVRYISKILKEKGLKVIVIRHPMPYAKFKEVVQRFASREDLKRSKITFEEREEFEPHIDIGNIVYDGVDYKKVLRQAEKEADIILWDGGNNDFPFIKSDLNIVLVDPHRPGDEISSHPGETNLRMADVIVCTKENTAHKKNIQRVISNVKKVNPNAKVAHSYMKLTLEPRQSIRGKRVLVVEDGPTLTHGNLPFGAGAIAANRNGAILVDPRSTAVGSIKKVFTEFPHIGKVLPAVGYSNKQIKELERTINSAKCDYVLMGTPMNISKVMNLNKPTIDVRYDFVEKTSVVRREVLRFIQGKKTHYRV